MLGLSVGRRALSLCWDCFLVAFGSEVSKGKGKHSGILRDVPSICWLGQKRKKAEARTEENMMLRWFVAGGGKK